MQVGNICNIDLPTVRKDQLPPSLVLFRFESQYTYANGKEHGIIKMFFIIFPFFRVRLFTLTNTSVNFVHRVSLLSVLLYSTFYLFIQTGGLVAFATDDFFGPCESMLLDSEPVFIHDKYTEFGKWMDGWETRRKRITGHDWCIIKLATKCVIKGIQLETSAFNHYILLVPWPKEVHCYGWF